MCDIKECLFKVQEVATKNDINFVTSLIDNYSKTKGQLSEKQINASREIYKKYLPTLIKRAVDNFWINHTMNETEYVNNKLMEYKNSLKSAFTENNVNTIIAKILINRNNDELTIRYISYRICGVFENIGIMKALASEKNLTIDEIAKQYLKP